MAHPMRKDLEGVVGHNAKLRRMTRHYGDADPAMKRNAPVDRMMTEGPEEAPEYGADAAAPNARADRPARRTTAANPMSTYAKGGAVKGRAMGGRMKKGKTNININVMPGPGGAQGQNGLPPPVLTPGGNPAIPPASAPPPMPLMAGGAPGMMPPGGVPGAPMMPPGAMPPGMMPPRKRGGRIEHKDEAADKKLVKAMVKGSSLKRATGGAVQNLQLKGNKVHMDDGAVSGPGRLEKTAARARNAKHETPQAV